MYSAVSLAAQNPSAGFSHRKWRPAGLHSSSNYTRRSSVSIRPRATNMNKEAAAENVLVGHHHHHPELINFVTGSKTCLGIEGFLSEKTWLITGATGFLGKVLVEKILRSIPDTKKIYLMIKAKDKEAAMHRLKTEIIEKDIFRVLKEVHGESYESFMLSKLVPVIGDFTQGSGLGIDAQTFDLVTREIDLMVNSAANTTLDERYDVALTTNTKGAVHLMGFANKCKNLKLFLHVSTMYSTGMRNGTVMEKAFSSDDTVAGHVATDEDNSPPPLLPDIASEFELAANYHNTAGSDEATASSLADGLKRLGLERARKFGWQNTYTFTKAMGEVLMGECLAESKVPVVIVRPSIIESTYADPFPGWIESNRSLDPVSQNYCKGRMTRFPANPNTILDVVPIDMVANVILAAVTRHGANPQAQGVHVDQAANVYQIGSSAKNPMTTTQLFMHYYNHFRSSPITVNGETVRVSGPLDICDTIEEFSSSLDGKSGPKMRQRVITMATLYKAYAFSMATYDCSNTEKLMEEMSEEERFKFGFDVTRIDWEHYITKIHLPGLRKHVMKETVQPKQEYALI